jgi:tetratricopeptide (TPR) repeat protein
MATSGKSATKCFSIVCAILLGAANCSAHAQQPARTPTLVLGTVQVVDQETRSKSINETSFESLIRALFSSDPAIRVATAETAGPAYFVLDSVLQTIQSSVTWTGRLREVGEPLGYKDYSFVAEQLLGPVSLVDLNGFRTLGLNEIAQLVRRGMINDTPQVQTPARYAIGCFKAGDDFGARAAAELRSDLRRVMQSRLKVQSVQLFVCPENSRYGAKRDPATAVIQGGLTIVKDQRAAGLEARSDIKLTLEWQGSLLPLPEFRRGRLYDLRERQNYLELVAGSIDEALNNTSRDDLKRIAAAFAEPGNARNLSEELIKQERLPRLALALLQSAKPNLTGSDAYLAGRAQQMTKDPRAAEASFRLAIETEGQPADVFRFLGKALIDQGKFSEAVDELSKAYALNPFSEEVVADYVQMLYLRGQKEEAAKVANQAVLSGGANSKVVELAAWIEIEKEQGKGREKAKYDTAVSLIRQGFARANAGDKALVGLTKRFVSNAQAKDTEYPALAVEQVLDLAIANAPDDAELFKLRGRHRFYLPYGAEQFRSSAADFRNAIAMLQRNGRNISFMDLELAEALFLNRNYEEAVKVAEEFVARVEKTEDNPVTAYTGIKTFPPVAHLIVASANFLLHRLPEPDVYLDGLLLNYSEWPAIKSRLPIGEKGSIVELTREEWSFGTFVGFACYELQGDEKLTVKQLVDKVQKRLRPTAEPQACTSAESNQPTK